MSGIYGGEWDIGGGVMVGLPDGGEADYLSPKDKPIVGPGDVTITRKGSAYEVKVSAPFTSCTLTAHGDGAELLIDGPSSAITDATDPSWQHCPFDFRGFRGEANVKMTIRGKPNSAVSVVLQLLPRASAAAPTIIAGSSAMAHFNGTRH